jgi:hypothetical protein
VSKEHQNPATKNHIICLQTPKTQVLKVEPLDLTRTAPSQKVDLTIQEYWSKPKQTSMPRGELGILQYYFGETSKQLIACPQHHKFAPPK